MVDDQFEGWSLIPAHGEILLQVNCWASADVGGPEVYLTHHLIVAWRVPPDCNGPEPVTVEHNKSGFQCCDRDLGALLMPNGRIFTFDGGEEFGSLDEYKAWALEQLMEEDSCRSRTQALKEAEMKLKEAEQQLAALRVS